MNSRMGDWWVRSETDPRWNCEGRAVCGGFQMPDDCKKALEEKTKTLGKPPKDLSWQYMKD